MKTHYDVLNVGRNCSAKEIKDSFIRLSKKYHPDKNNSSDAHRKFVEVNEAYSVLGKYNSRCKYDETLSYEKPKVVYKQYTTTKTPYEDFVEMYASQRRRHQGMKDGYIIRTKLTTVCFCFFLMALGSALHLLAESRSANHSHRIACKVKEQRHRMRAEWKLQERQQAMHKNKVSNMDQGEE